MKRSAYRHAHDKQEVDGRGVPAAQSQRPQQEIRQADAHEAADPPNGIPFRRRRDVAQEDRAEHEKSESQKQIRGAVTSQMPHEVLAAITVAVAVAEVALADA